MLDAALSFTWLDAAMDHALLDDDVQHLPTIAANYSALEFSDGYATASIVTQSEFEGYTKALGIPEVANDDRFKDIHSRNANSDEYRRIVSNTARNMSVHDFLRGSKEHDVPASGINTLDTVVNEPQVIHNESFAVREHPVAGSIREARNAPRFKGTPTEIPDHAPTMGQHSDEIVSALGLDATVLRAAGVIF
jgi:crotonobetainyl-CoA:carnitine CoA-transferase CaiB-like acyl-CoA transferase